MKARTKILAVVVMLGAWRVCFAAELHIPEEYPTIQSGIDATVDGDTVIVADGVYTGTGNRNIVVCKAITVRSQNGPKNCIIDCEGQGRGFQLGYFEQCGQVKVKCVLDGFTIINGKNGAGGAILCEKDSSPMIKNCIIHGNEAQEGSGIFCIESSPTIYDCSISGNIGISGGGIMAWESDGEIINCKIINNSSDSEGGISWWLGNLRICDSVIKNNRSHHALYQGILCADGSITIDNCIICENEGVGVRLFSSKSASITGCQITANTEGGIASWFSERAALDNCVITGNRANREGAGVRCIFGLLTIANCTISGNKGIGSGGICYWGGNELTINNSIVWGNEAPEGWEIYLENEGESYASISYSDIEGGKDAIYVGDDFTLNWEVGNIDLEPYFVRQGYWEEINDINIIPNPDEHGEPWNYYWVEGDYRLRRQSPCVDAGTDANVYVDIKGNIRPYDFPGIDNNGDEPEFDMGAYELTPVEAQVSFTPKVLNCRSRGKWIKAHIALPEGISAEDIDVNAPAVVVPFGVESQYIKVAGHNPAQVEIGFDRQAICASAGKAREIEAAVIGSLTDGRYFAGTDKVQVKN